MSCRARADVFVGRVRDGPTGIPDNDFVKLVLKVFTIQMFRAWINERDCSNSDGVYPRNSPERAPMSATSSRETGRHTLAKAARDFPGGGMAGVDFDVDALTALPIQLECSSRQPLLNVET
jgi:hypothetical protein